MLTDDFIIRTTRWVDNHGDVRQISVCVLDADWEPQAHDTRSVGPFDDPQVVEQECSAAACAAAWWTTGQGRLAI